MNTARVLSSDLPQQHRNQYGWDGLLGSGDDGVPQDVVGVRSVYEVIATREGDWWAIVADLGDREVASQAKRLDQVEPMIREAISLVLDVDEHGFDIEVTPSPVSSIEGQRA